MSRLKMSTMISSSFLKYVVCAPPLPQTFIARLTIVSKPFGSTRGIRGLPNSSVGRTASIGMYDTVTP
jgi:hypothetical protein